MLILKYEKGRVPKKKGRGEHPAKSAKADHCSFVVQFCLLRHPGASSGTRQFAESQQGIYFRCVATFRKPEVKYPALLLAEGVSVDVSATDC